MKSLLLFFVGLLSAPFLMAADGEPLTLAKCGNIIGHEMGLWEFTQATPSPEQVDKVLRSRLKFVKISLRKLKDGVWVVNHDPTISVSLGHDRSKKIQLDSITWADVQAMKSEPGSSIPIYRLEDYVNRDMGKLCWMLTTKVPADENLINLIATDLKIQDRTVLLTGGLADVKFLASFDEALRLNFAGRIGNQINELEDYRPYVSRLWAMEVDPTSKASEVIQAAKQMGFKAYIDSMRYSKTYEIFDTACEIVFKMGADFTQTNRPLKCMSKMKQ